MGARRLCGATGPAAAAEAPAAEESAGAPAAAPAAPPPTAKQLARLDDQRPDWEALTRSLPRRVNAATGGRRGALLEAPSNRLATCPASRSAASTAPASCSPAAHAEAVERLCDALRLEHCELTRSAHALKMRVAEARARGGAGRAAHGPPMQTLVVEHAARPQFLGLRELPQGAHKSCRPRAPRGGRGG